jgi:CRP/FNR family transcriptional regulator, cyclic AMP receptor protein
MTTPKLAALTPAKLAHLFDQLPPKIADLARHGRIERFATDVVLTQEGKKDDTLHVLLSGRIKVFDNNEDGQEITYGVFGAGDYFGEMTLDGGPRSASVVALEPTVCAILSQAAVRSYIATHGDFAFELIVTLISRVRNATRIARELTLVSVYGRLARFVERSATVQIGGTRTIEERLTQTDIAARIGASRESVSRILNDWERDGFIRIVQKRITVLRALPERP